MSGSAPPKKGAVTPLRRAVDEYIGRSPARFHMPGHKGAASSFLGDALRYDITEVRGADSLYEADGAIAETEARYTALYGTAGSFLSAGGSTLCIQTMLALVARPGGKIICGRGIHTAALNAMALLDLTPVWIIPERDPATGLSLPVSPAQVEAALRAAPDALAVYLTSPDYFGVLCDIAAVSAACRASGVPLLVDNAHGAHLRFLSPDGHPIALGAHLCCDSLHKTLPVLTGGALLHAASPQYARQAKQKMSLFGSTSPSYLIMQSVDEALPPLEDGRFAAELRQLADRVAELEHLAVRRGFLLPSGKKDPTRLSLGFAPLGLRREAFLSHLDACGVEPEYCADTFCVFLPGADNSAGDFARLRKVIETAERLPAPLPPTPDSWRLPDRALGLRAAVLSESETIPLSHAVGRVCAGMIAPCPPGIPLVIPGELLDRNLCDILQRYGIFSANVIK